MPLVTVVFVLVSIIIIVIVIPLLPLAQHHHVSLTLFHLLRHLERTCQ
jgi:hypothetical protein